VQTLNLGGPSTSISAHLINVQIILDAGPELSPLFIVQKIIAKIPARHYCASVRIESIDFNRSTETELALITSPPVDAHIYQEFQKLVANSAPLSTVQFREEANRLCVSTSSLSLKLRDTIEDFLTNAEQLVSQARRAEAEKERLDTQRKERAISAAARAMGLRIRRVDSEIPRLPERSRE
jgi:hypothetical protein